MKDDTDRYEQLLRHRDARNTMLTSIAFLVVAAAAALGSLAVWLLVFVVVRDAETTVRIPTVAIWGLPLLAFLFGVAGFRGLSDALDKRRSARELDRALSSGELADPPSGSSPYAHGL